MEIIPFHLLSRGVFPVFEFLLALNNPCFVKMKVLLLILLLCIIGVFGDKDVKQLDTSFSNININIIILNKILQDLPSDAQLRIGVKKRVSAEDCKIKSKKGDKLSMHYVGTLRKDGSKFDSSRDRDSPFEFTLGSGQVIKGWDRGLVDMCIGEIRKLTIPSDLGYGDRGSPPKIPGGATLVFEVELLDIKGRKEDL